MTQAWGLLRRSAAIVSLIGGGRPSRQIAAKDGARLPDIDLDSDNRAAFQETMPPVPHPAWLTRLLLSVLRKNS